MQLFLERTFILSKSLIMRGVDVYSFCRAWRTDLESGWMINFEDLWLAITLMARSISSVTSTL